MFLSLLKAFLTTKNSTFGPFWYENMISRFEDKTTDPEILWRLARVIHDLGKNELDAAKQAKLLRKSLEIAEMAVQNAAEPGNWSAYYWYACCMFSVGLLVEGRIWMLRKADEIKLNFERALELNPGNASIWHWLGKIFSEEADLTCFSGLWHFKAADLTRAEKLLAFTILRRFPSSTYEEAVGLFSSLSNPHSSSTTSKEPRNSSPASISRTYSTWPRPSNDWTGKRKLVNITRRRLTSLCI